ncbi:MAG: hypothetical protein M1818_005705 [Claussenomyces sp. TS43310]|nr:MAG: hypothetical protein M1818_005705 [Claussenomyces sp. TS43310]
MDPIYLAAKEKYRLPKLPPSKEPTPFQQQLAKNPYAQALATPVRMCSLTRISLPSFFLQDFEIVTHPDTREPWYLPRSLVSSHQPLPSPSSEASKSLRPQSARPTTFGSKSYTLSRMSLLHAMHVQRSGYDNGHRNFPMPNIKQSRAFQKYDIKFREDTDTFVLELMRRRTVERMKYLCDLKRGYLVSCKAQEGGEMAVGVWEDAKMKKGTAAMLWLGPIAGSKGEDIAEPGEFSTLDVEKELKCKIPVHNLPRLLGPTYVEDLRRYAPHMFGAEVVVLKHRRLTVDLQLRLWKLQGYLATFEPFLY